MTDATAFTKLVPGFDFLQSLVKNAGSALPNIGQWVAPTLNPEELEKRIEELRTVQFWLEQNARMLGATIQALEVQRMTLSTLKTMNVQMEDLRDSLRIKVPDSSESGRSGGLDGTAAQPADPRERAPEHTAEHTSEHSAKPKPSAAKTRSKAKNASLPPPPAVDPLQWWGALTKQFTELAATAMKDNAADAARNLATSVVKQSFDAASAAGQTLKKAAAVPGNVARKVTGAPGKRAKSDRGAKSASSEDRTRGGAGARRARRAPSRA